MLFPHPTLITKSPENSHGICSFSHKIFGKTIKWIPRCGSLFMWANMAFVSSKMILYRAEKRPKEAYFVSSFIGVYPWFFSHLLQSILSFSTKVTFHLMINSWNSNIRITLLFKMRVQGWNLMDSDFDDSSKNEFLGKGNYWWCCIIVFLEGSFLVLVWAPFFKIHLPLCFEHFSFQIVPLTKTLKKIWHFLSFKPPLILGESPQPNFFSMEKSASAWVCILNGDFLKLWVSCFIYSPKLSCCCLLFFLILKDYH